MASFVERRWLQFSFLCVLITKLLCDPRVRFSEVIESKTEFCDTAFTKCKSQIKAFRYKEFVLINGYMIKMLIRVYVDKRPR